MNKKAEGSLRTYVMVTILALATLTIFSNLVVDFSGTYGVTEIDEFKYYEDIYNETDKEFTQDFIQSQDNLDSSTNSSSGFLTGLFDKVQDYFSESLVVRGWNSVRKIPKLFKYATLSIQNAFSQVGLDFPNAFRIAILSLIGLTGIFLVVKAYWERNIG